MRVMYYTASAHLRPQTVRLVPGHVYLEWVARRKMYTVSENYPSINIPIHTTSLNGNETKH